MDEKKKEQWKGFLEIAFYIFLAAAIVYFVLMFVAQRTNVIGSSMYPTLKDGDRLIVEKVSYHFHAPERFDIIVLNYLEPDSEESVHYIKRIIGLPGETIQIEDGSIYIDGERLTESYGYYLDNQTMLGYNAENPITIGDDEYFVLGDNRNDSLDSRKIGCIKRSDIVGHACFRLAPLATLGVIK